MDDVKDPVIVLDDDECWRRLATRVVGRIVTRVGDVVDIFPVNYVVDGESIVLRTAEGSKLMELVISEDVLFEVDEHTAEDAWSVIIRGKAKRLEREAEQFHARVREGFLELAAAEPERFLVLDASLPIDELHTAIIARVAPLVTR